MAIEFGCGCGRRYRVPEAMAGRRARCRSCRRLVDVPAFVPAAAAWSAPADPGWPAWRKAATVLWLVMMGCEAGYLMAGGHSAGPVGTAARVAKAAWAWADPPPAPPVVQDAPWQPGDPLPGWFPPR